MPTLRITVVDPPSEFTGHERITLLLPTSDGYAAPISKSDRAIAFDVPFELKADKSGTLQASGPLVQRGNDGRRFVYLAWLGTSGGTTTMFRRLKVFFDTAPDFPGTSDRYEIKVKGTDKRGGPACATAEVLKQ